MKRRSILNNTEFRPRLPKDPFGETPWVLDVAQVEDLSRKNTTVLVLNTPPLADLAALLCASPALAAGLVIIATHDVPTIPPSWTIHPTLRILKLNEPIFGAHAAAGALGLMSVLDRAARFVSTPHLARAGRKVLVYVEDPVSREFTVPLSEDDQPLAKKASSSALSFLSIPPTPQHQSSTEKLRRRRTMTFGFGTSASSSASSSMVSSPASSVLSLLSTNSGVSPASSVTGTSSVPSSPFASGRPIALSPVPSGTRPFDTLIHYLTLPPSFPYNSSRSSPPNLAAASSPPKSSSSKSPNSTSPSPGTQTGPGNNHVSEKVLLKQAILVTTLAAPYLAVPPELPKHLHAHSSRRRTMSNTTESSAANGSRRRLSISGSKSVPDRMEASLRKRRSTVVAAPAPLPLPEEDRYEQGEFGEAPMQTSKSTSSFKALKRKLTLRRTSTAPQGLGTPVDTSPAPRVPDADSSLTSSKRKRFSLGSLTRSGTSRRSSVYGGENASRPTEESKAAEAYVEMQLQKALIKGAERYRGRPHILHVLVDPSSDGPFSSGSSSLSPSPNPNRRSAIYVPTKPPQLVKALEQFLVAFAFPAPNLAASISSMSTTTHSSGHSESPPNSPRSRSTGSVSPRLGSPRPGKGGNTPMDTMGRANAVAGAMTGVGGEAHSTKPVPFVMRSGELGALMRFQTKSVASGDVPGDEVWAERSLAECLCMGAIDGGEYRGAWRAWFDVYGDSIIVNVGLEGEMGLDSSTLPGIGLGTAKERMVDVRKRTVDELVGDGALVEDDTLSAVIPPLAGDSSLVNPVPEVTVTGVPPTATTQQRHVPVPTAPSPPAARTTARSTPLLLAQTKPSPPAVIASAHRVTRKAISPSHYTQLQPQSQQYLGPQQQQLTPNPSPSPPSSTSGHGHSDDNAVAEPLRESLTEIAVTAITVDDPDVSIGQQHRQAIQIPLGDKNFHLPKQPSREVLRRQAQPQPDAQAVETPRKKRTDRERWDDTGENRQTGLLTPPESRSSVSSEEGVVGLASPPSPSPAPANFHPALSPPTLPGSESGVTQSESFDFVDAYTYDRSDCEEPPTNSRDAEAKRRSSVAGFGAGPGASAGSVGLGIGIAPTPTNQGGPTKIVAAHMMPRVPSAVASTVPVSSSNSTTVSTTVKALQPSKLGPRGQQQHARDYNHGSMNAKDTQDYANDLRRYREVEQSSTTPDDASANGSVSSVKTTRGRNLSMSMDSESVVDGRKEACSMMGVPPSIGYEDVVLLEGSASEKTGGGLKGPRKSMGRFRSKGNVSMAPNATMEQEVPVVVVDQQHVQLPQQMKGLGLRAEQAEEGSEKRSSSKLRYHYKKKAGGKGDVSLSVEEARGDAPLKKRRSSRFGEFVGRVFSAGSSPNTSAL